MKNLILCALTVCMIAACKKDSVFNEYGYYGAGTAKLNGKDWQGITGIFTKNFFCLPPDTCVAIKLQKFSPDGALRGDITFDFIPLKTGKHTINYVWPTWSDIQYKLTYSEYISDGDVITGGYYVFEQNDENYLNITELNLKTGDMRGSFRATVVRGSSWTYPGSEPDTIRITDGSFYGKIFWR